MFMPSWAAIVCKLLISLSVDEVSLCVSPRHDEGTLSWCGCLGYAAAMAEYEAMSTIRWIVVVVMTSLCLMEGEDHKKDIKWCEPQFTLWNSPNDCYHSSLSLSLTLLSFYSPLTTHSEHTVSVMVSLIIIITMRNALAAARPVDVPVNWRSNICTTAAKLLFANRTTTSLSRTEYSINNNIRERRLTVAFTILCMIEDWNTLHHGAIDKEWSWAAADWGRAEHIQ